MEWLKRLWQKYMVGVGVNDFPIKDCGLAGDKLKNPRNLAEAVTALVWVVEFVTTSKESKGA